MARRPKSQDGFERAIAILRGDAAVAQAAVADAIESSRSPVFIPAGFAQHSVAPFDAPSLADVPPRVEPPSLPVVDPSPKSHRLVAWRHDGGLQNFTYNTLEVAREHARALSWVIYWKWAIMCGRDMLERELIEQPA